MEIEYAYSFIIRDEQKLEKQYLSFSNESLAIATFFELSMNTLQSADREND